MADPVTLEDVVKYYGDVLAVDNVNLKVHAGEFFSLLGPSGCGKTTTLRIIAGFERPSSGFVRIGDEIVNEVPAYRRNVGMVFQNLALFPHLNVYDNIAFGLRMKRLSRGEIQERVKSTLELVGLPGLGARRIKQLSGGQQQRVALARALVTEPSVLCLDEPLGALDLKLRLQMQLELKRLHRRVGNTFVFVTHDQSESITMSDKIAVMNQGRVEQVDFPQTVYDRPATKFVADFIGEANILKGKAEDEGNVVVGTIVVHANVPEGLVGRQVYVCIRPERIELGKGGPSGLENTFRGEVEEVVYKGSVLVYRVKLADASVSVQSDPLDQPHRLGETITVSWSKAASSVVAR